MSSVKEQLSESAKTISSLSSQAELIESMSKDLIDCFKRGGKIMTFGNGGSACDAQNYADELVGRLRRNRPPLSALSLTVNTSDLTSIANDFGFEHVFERQLQAHARPGDIAIGISTSGNSANVLKALEAARKLKLVTHGLTGESGGKMKALSDKCLCVPSKTVARIQEAHITVIQIICDIVEDTMFPGAPKAH